MFIKTRYSACCASSLCLKPFHASSALDSQEDFFANDLGIITESLEECAGRFLTWKEAMEEKGLSKFRKNKDHDPWYRPGPSAEFRGVSMRSLTHWSGQQHHLLKQLQALGTQDCREFKRLAKDSD